METQETVGSLIDFSLFPPPELPPSALTLSPNTRQLFRGERFTVQCPVSETNSSGWTLKHFSSSRRHRKTVLYPDQCSPLGGAVNADNPDACVFTAEHGGLYWCQGPEGRSNSVNITVSCESCVRVKNKQYSMYTSTHRGFKNVSCDCI